MAAQHCLKPSASLRNLGHSKFKARISLNGAKTPWTVYDHCCLTCNKLVCIVTGIIVYHFRAHVLVLHHCLIEFKHLNGLRRINTVHIRSCPPDKRPHLEGGIGCLAPRHTEAIDPG